MKRSCEELTDSDDTGTKRPDNPDAEPPDDESSSDGAQGVHDSRSVLRLLLDGHCRCMKRRHKDTSRTPCWAPFRDASLFEALCAEREAFKKMHKLDQDRNVRHPAAGTEHCRSFPMHSPSPSSSHPFSSHPRPSHPCPRPIPVFRAVRISVPVSVLIHSTLLDPVLIPSRSR